MPIADTVYVVDDDPSTRALIVSLIEHLPYEHAAFPSVEDFLEDFPRAPAGCIVLDVRLPGRSGLDLQQELMRREVALPVIFVTGHADVRMAVQSMRLGAIDFIEKPFRPQLLLDSITSAMAESKRIQEDLQRRGSLRDRFALLTPREWQVISQVADGMTNKAIAAKLSVSSQAIDARRINAMEKLGVSSVARLVQVILRFQALSSPGTLNRSEASSYEIPVNQEKADWMQGGAATQPGMA